MREKDSRESAVESRQSKTVKDKETCPYLATLHTVYGFLRLTSGVDSGGTNGLMTDVMKARLLAGSELHYR